MTPRRRTLTALATGLGAAAVIAGGPVLAGQASTVSATAKPPVVVILFDEFPTTSLLDASGRIDAVRYPSFARLAQGSNWFRYATAPVDETGRAIEILLTGSMAERKRPATYARNPRSLFTLLGAHRYRMNVSEELSSLCPRRLCPNVKAQNRASVLRELASGRPERLTRWVRSLRASHKPTLYFKHVLLPHVPLHYLPSGRHYSKRPHEPIPGLTNAFHNRWLVTQAYQRHLLQLGFTDRALGRILDRLRRTGLYDRSLIVATADNGESFGRFYNRHEISRGNAVDIALTPLFVKRPGQRRGRLVRRHVRTLDVLPTIAGAARLRLPWRTQGVSLFGPRARRIPGGVTMMQRSGRRIHLSYGALHREGRAALEHKLALFGSGTRPPGLYGVGPDAPLRGTPVTAWPTDRARGAIAKLDAVSALRSVRRRSRFLPSHITGRLVGSRARKVRTLALAVNGVIVATSPSFRLRGLRGRYFSAMVPEESFTEGRNRVQVLSVSHTPGGLRLSALN